MPSTISPLYTLFFLTLEPLTALAGFIAAACYPAHYLHLTSPQTTSASGPVPPATAITLAQLANLYLLFAINEALVLRATRDVAVWRALLLGLLIADVGHLWSVKELGWGIYWRFWEWNSMAFGNVGIVYAGMTMRVLFLAGVGVSEGAIRQGAKTK